MKPIELISDNLSEEGLRMEVEIMPSADFMKQKGWNMRTVPVFRTQALFDTGAKLCAVDRSIIKALGVTPYQTCPVKTPYHTVESEVYQLIFKIPGRNGYFPVTAVIADLSADEYKAFIGRDFLRYCTLVYDGANEKGYLLVQK